MLRSFLCVLLCLITVDVLHAESKFDWKIYQEKMKSAVKRGKISEKQASEAYRLIKFYTALDANRNQIIEPSEFEKSRYRSTVEKRIREAGLDPRRPFKLETFAIKRLENAGISSGELRDVFRAYKPKDHEQISLDLPDEFADFDVDADNQVGLYEWPKSQLDEFFELDANDDGFVTAREIAISQSETEAAETPENEPANR